MTEDSAADLQRRFGIDGVAAFEAGQNGLLRLRLTPPAAEAHVYLHGGHVTHWQPRGAEPVLFLSARSRFDPRSAIRGGVPIIFPWFGAKADDPKAPQHGFARTAPWRVEALTREGDAVGVVLRCEPDEAARAAWPHRHTLRHRIRVGATLEMTLEVENGSSEPLGFEEALHTYLAVRDVRETSVTGLAGTTYIDKVAGMTRTTEGQAPVRLGDETDRVYLDTRATCIVDDPGGRRRLVVDKDGSASTVVWNPWVAKAKALSDFGDDEWIRMICIETANAADDRIRLAPGQRHAMRAVLRVEPR
jgi:glucose-6-phosphate 1-epimerase